MFWTIVGAILFVFVGIPLILLVVLGIFAFVAATIMGEKAKPAETEGYVAEGEKDGELFDWEIFDEA